MSTDEWSYLISSRGNGLYKYGVTVSDGGTDYTNCLIIAPDDYSGTALSSITDWSLSNINSLGLVCLPAAGVRDGSSMYYGGSDGYYWSATPYERNEDYAYGPYFNGSNVYEPSNFDRCYGYSVRLFTRFLIKFCLTNQTSKENKTHIFSVCRLCSGGILPPIRCFRSDPPAAFRPFHIFASGKNTRARPGR